MKILIATDAWFPQVNGVVRSLDATIRCLLARGHEVEMVTPADFASIPCPTYPEIRLALGCRRKVAERLSAFSPDAIHIATEGPIGWAARSWCRKKHRSFTTCFHTRFPDYAAARTGLPAAAFWPFIRRFHAPARRVMVATPSLAAELTARGIGPVHLWSRGVDLARFGRPAGPPPAIADLPRPILLSVGRVAVEKNLEAFLSLDTPGTKVVVGDGPALEEYRRRFPDTHFLGKLEGDALVGAYRAADLFVFPSRTDTFGLVNIEALACGLPVAAFPVPGPVDIIGLDGCGVHGGTRRIGALDENLEAAIDQALGCDPFDCETEASHYRWSRCTDAFLEGLSDFADEQTARANRATPGLLPV